MAGLFQVLYGKGNGTFRKAEVLKGTDDQPLIIPTKDKNQLTEKICTRPFAVDWDGDGHLDLVVGNFAGTFYWFRGQGKGKFQPKPEPILAGGSPLRTQGAHSDPFIVDWDGDGDLDLVSGSSAGGVYWAENKAGKGKLPELQPFKTLIEPGRRTESGELLAESDLSGPSHATRIWVADVNGDGKLDLLVGDDVTLVAAAKGVSKEEFKKKYAKWKEDFKAVSEELRKAGSDGKAQAQAREEYQRVCQSRSKFMDEEMTGFVWLYLRK